MPCAPILVQSGLASTISTQHVPTCTLSPGTFLRPLCSPSSKWLSAGPNNPWLDFHANRLWEYRTAWGARYSLTADLNAVAEASDPDGLSSELMFFETYLAARTGGDRSVGHIPEARTPQLAPFPSASAGDPSTDGNPGVPLCR